jgi:Flp pilus assembly protein TadD
VRALRRAVELAPESAYARAQLAAALLSLGRTAEAEPELREALRIAPADAEATFNLATMLWQTGRRDEARTWYRRFLEVAPPSYIGPRRLAAARSADAPPQAPGPGPAGPFVAPPAPRG